MGAPASSVFLHQTCSCEPIQGEPADYVWGSDGPLVVTLKSGPAVGAKAS